ncbi:MAG: hypothetical protein AAF662_10020 [Pseudomonadota bacterium]
MIDTISKGLKKLIAENKALRDRVEELEKDREMLDWVFAQNIFSCEKHEIEGELLESGDPAFTYSVSWYDEQWSFNEIDDQDHPEKAVRQAMIQ